MTERRQVWFLTSNLKLKGPRRCIVFASGPGFFSAVFYAHITFLASLTSF